MKNFDSFEWIDNFIDNHKSQLGNNLSKFENIINYNDKKIEQIKEIKKENNNNIINQLLLENKQLKELNILKDQQIFYNKLN